MTRFEQNFWDQKGFEELRKLCRQGSEFSKEIANIFNERSKIEQTYAEQLSKLSIKATKLCSKDVIGTIKTTWESMSREMEDEAEIHRSLGVQIHDETFKQIKVFLEGQTKSRKMAEVNVDKAYKTFIDKLNDSIKAKKTSHSKSKEAETMHQQLEDVRVGKGKVLSDKDITKVENKFRKATDSSSKADKEYRDLYQLTERTRLEWESAMSKCCQTCEKLEEERLNNHKDIFSLYSNMLAAVVPQLQQNYENIQQETYKMEPADDVKLMADNKGIPREPSEQVLYDCYEEDLETTMNFDRRKEALENKIKIFTAEVEKEKNTREGIKTLFETYSDNPEYCNDEGRQDVTLQLNHANAVIDSLQSSLYKLQCALAKLQGQEQPTYYLMDYISTSKDKQSIGTLQHKMSMKRNSQTFVTQGMTQSVLRIPLDQAPSRDYDSDGQIDEFDDDFGTETVLCRCTVLYEFAAEQSDQLSIFPGDVISVTEKQNDGWWKGECHNKKGFFPGSYVEEIH